MKQGPSERWLNVFKAEMSPRRYWRDLRRWGKKVTKSPTYRCSVTTRMNPALRRAAMKAILMFQKEVRDKVTRQCPQTAMFEEKGEPKRIRTEVPLLTSL